MAVLNAATRKEMPKSEFGQPEKRGFPMNDKTHDRLAISGATRAEHAGNISESEADKIKSEARAKLGEKGGDPPAGDHKGAVAKMHPEHVHKLVQDAHAGKFGPEAQKTAQKAMQAPPAGAPGEQEDEQASQAAKPNYAEMFSGNAPADDDSDQSVPAGQMFSGR